MGRIPKPWMLVIAVVSLGTSGKLIGYGVSRGFPALGEALPRTSSPAQTAADEPARAGPAAPESMPAEATVEAPQESLARSAAARVPSLPPPPRAISAPRSDPLRTPVVPAPEPKPQAAPAAAQAATAAPRATPTASPAPPPAPRAESSPKSPPDGLRRDGEYAVCTGADLRSIRATLPGRKIAFRGAVLRQLRDGGAGRGMTWLVSDDGHFTVMVRWKECPRKLSETFRFLREPVGVRFELKGTVVVVDGDVCELKVDEGRDLP